MAALEITTVIGCANSCSYCPQGKLLNAYPEGVNVVMDVDTFNRCLEKVPRYVAIHFSGFSEPYQNPDCARMISTARDRGHQVTIYTTLQFARYRDLDASPASGIELYIHVLNPEVMCLGSGDVKNWIEKVKYLIEKGREFAFVKVGDWDPPAEILAVLDLAPVIKQPLITRSTKPGPSGRPYRCEGDRQDQGVLLPNGDVALCCEDYGLKHMVGNLLRDSYRDLFTSPERNKIREAMMGEERDVICQFCNRRRAA